MALTNTPKRPQVAKFLGLAAEPAFHGEEKAAQTYLLGAFVQDDDAGRITECASPIDGTAVTKRAIGMALRAATGVTDADAPIAYASEATIFEVTLSDATAGTLTLAQTHKWKCYPLTKSTHWYLDGNAVGDSGGGIVVGFKDPIGTVDPRVYMILSASARGGANAGSFLADKGAGANTQSIGW